MSSNYINIPAFGDRHWQAPVATAFDLPTNGNQAGDVRVALDTGVMYLWTGSAWIEEVVPGATPPGGSDTQVQFNHVGAFAGSPNLTFNGVTLTAAGLNTGFTQGSVAFMGMAGNYAQNNNDLFWDDTNGYFGVKLAGVAPQASVDVGIASPITVDPVVAGSTSLNNLTGAATPPSSASAFQDSNGAGYTANGNFYQYGIWTYTTLNGANFGSGPATAGFSDTNDGQQFESNVNWSAGGGAGGQVIQQMSPGNIVQLIGVSDTNFIDNNNMTQNGNTPADVVSNAYHSDGSALNITYHIYSYKTIGGVKTYAAVSFDVVTVDPNDGGYYIPFVSWSAVAGVGGYKVIRSTDSEAADVGNVVSLYDSPHFTSWSGVNTVLPNSFSPPSIRVAGSVSQASNNWSILADGEVTFTGLRTDSSGFVYTGTVFTNGGYLHMGGGNIDMGGGTIGSGPMYATTLQTSGTAQLQGLTLIGATGGLQVASNGHVGFFNATTVAQQTGDISAALLAYGLVASPTLPNPSTTVKGGVISIAGVAHQWLSALSTSGVFTQSQPGFSDLSGQITTGQLPGTTGSGSVVLATAPTLSALTVTGNTSSGAGVIHSGYQTASPSNASTVTCSANTPGILLTPGGGLTSLVIKLPSIALDGYTYFVASSQAITTVTWQDSGGTAGNVIGGQATIGGTNRGQQFMYSLGNTKWYSI